MIKKAIFIGYFILNIGYLIASFFFLLLATMYYNGVIIPDSLRWDANGKEWKGGLVKENIAFLGVFIVEFLILYFLLRFINEQLLFKIVKPKNPKTILKWTSNVYLLFGIIIFVFLIYVASTPVM